MYIVFEQQYQMFRQDGQQEVFEFNRLTSNLAVTDNADLILLRDGLDILLTKLAKCIKGLADFAIEYRNVPCLGQSLMR